MWSRDDVSGRIHYIAPVRGPGGRGGDLSLARKVRAPWNHGAG